MSVPADLARMSPQQLQDLQARAAMDEQASPEAKAKLNRYIQRELATRTATD